MNEPQTAGGVGDRTPLNFQPKTKSDHMALKIARAFKEENRLPLYRACCENFEEEGIRKAFSEAMAVPDDKIKKSRSALFVYLMKKYAKRK
jgi:hypothetical protein